MNTTTTVKQWANRAFRILVSPLVAVYKLECALMPEHRRDTVFQTWSQILSALPGYTGQYIRRAFYRAVLPECHLQSCIHWGTVFTSRDVSIAEGVYIGARCMIGRAALERHVTIGSNVDILSGKRQHCFDDPDRPIQQQGGVYERIRIGENTWIGNDAVVMADVGRRCVVAAGSVVVHPVEDDSIVGGHPARVLRRRPVTRISSTTPDGEERTCTTQQPTDG